jgi:dTMP kinase
MKGKLIVLDGTDGTGKHTQTILLKENLEKLGYCVETIDFPQYGTKAAGPTEEYLNGKYGSPDEVGAYRASILYAVDRYAASFKIKQWLLEGKIVLCDRYVSANMGHQAGKIINLEKRDQFLEWLEDLEFNIFKIPKPDINILLYIDTEIARKLAQDNENKKFTNDVKKNDVHEKDPEHMKKALNSFLYVAEKYNWIKINCSNGNDWIKTREEISLEIFNKIKEKGVFL